MIELSTLPPTPSAAPGRPQLLATTSAESFAVALTALTLPSAAPAVPGEIPIDAKLPAGKPELPARHIPAAPGKDLPPDAAAMSDADLLLLGDSAPADESAAEADPVAAAPVDEVPAASVPVEPAAPVLVPIVPVTDAPASEATATVRPLCAEAALATDKPIKAPEPQPHPGKVTRAEAKRTKPAQSPQAEGKAELRGVPQSEVADSKPTREKPKRDVAAQPVTSVQPRTPAAATPPAPTPAEVPAPAQPQIAPLVAEARPARAPREVTTASIAAAPARAASGPAEVDSAPAAPVITDEMVAALKPVVISPSVPAPAVPIAAPVVAMQAAAPAAVVQTPTAVSAAAPTTSAPTLAVPQATSEPVAPPAPPVPPVASAPAPAPAAPNGTHAAANFAPLVLEPAPRRFRPSGEAQMTLLAPAQPTLAPQVVAPAADSGQAALDTRRQEWTGQMIDMIEAMRDEAPVKETRMRLAPEALGNVEISVRRDGDRLHVHFTADTPAARQLLAEAQPRLAEIAESRGVRLGQTSVDGGAAGQGHNSQRHDAEARQPSRPASARRGDDTERKPTTTDERIA